MEHTTIKLAAALVLFAACGCEPSQDLPPSSPSPAASTPAPEAPVAETGPDRVKADQPVRQRQSAIGRAYFNSRERVENYTFDNAITLYHAEHGEYPKSHEEFMEKLWKPLKAPMPEIEEGYEYRYDPAEHAMYKQRIDQEQEEDAAAE